MIKEIKSRQNDLVKDVIKLHNSQYRKEKGLFIVEGFHLLEMALEANLVSFIFTTKELDINKDILQYIVTEEIIEKVSSNKNPQSVIAICKLLKEDEIKNDKVLYLDDVSDPGNMGTILRTALAFGYKDVVLSPNSVSIYNEKVIQSSQGAIFKLNISLSGIEKLKELKKSGYQIISTSLHTNTYLKDLSINEKRVVVLGNESRGISKVVEELSDTLVKIEIDEIESLNVGVAGGIIMYHLK